MEQKVITTDLLVIGGGTAGCYAAWHAAQLDPNLRITVVEKADIRRSGCLAAGVNALNAYITKGKTPDFYVDYAKNDAAGIVREDLLLTLSQRLNHVTAELEKMGLVILKDANGDYVTRGDRNLKINGENIKPLLARAVRKHHQIKVINHVNVVDYLVAGQQIYGAVGFSTTAAEAYVFHANAVIIATGGASGLYRPNNPGFSKHKMWYPPFNTGAGYAMGLRAGAEMTTFEMRFIALRCKDTIAPVGTIAQGVGAKQINALGEVYEQKYGLRTAERVYGTVQEMQAGRGPCYLQTDQITPAQEQDLYHAYLNMAPAQTLKWLEAKRGPRQQNVEIEGTEPYIVGGHAASGYWVSTERETTIHGLFAAGDVAGGAPQKYVTGALAEGEIAAEAAVKRLQQINISEPPVIATQIAVILQQAQRYLQRDNSIYKVRELEEAMQKVMDSYAGGITTHYEYNGQQLVLAQQKIAQLQQLSEQMAANDMHELMSLYEVRERLLICQCVIAHLAARKETRWHSFAENLDYPQQDPRFDKYVNSIYRAGKIQIIFRELVKRRQRYEHQN
ncbi:adenylyl-sulfate reductase subunit alpha [Loigolactobacillus binensis]|uniref:adenylyl-sulfate reductase subunit alpha n=1 Tax=Loigolactobacillus binensis TaxID=2559922 RepID=UPI0021E02ADD|nr:adenylyl-sulfate reductase subunit alpha [Loigolactobacillus binensis]